MKLRRFKSFFPAICIFILLVFCQAEEYLFSEQDMEVITKISANILIREHYSKKNLNDDTSEKIFDEYLRMLDPSRIYFTQKDISSISNYKTLLDDQILSGDFKFAFIVFQMLSARISNFNSFAKKMISDGVDFNEDEEWLLDRSEADWPIDNVERTSLWRKKVKNDILTFKLMLKSAEKELSDGTKKTEEFLWIKAFKPEERVLKRYSNYLRNLNENTSIDKLEIYLSALATVFDPYSAYMAPKSMEDFNIQMSLSLTGIGATLSQQDGYTKIIDLVPGGPAELSGKLNPGDRIIAVAQEGEEPVDVVDMPLNKVVSLIRGKKDSFVTLTVLPGKKGLGAPPLMVEIKRDKITLKDQEAQSSLIEHNFGETKFKIGIIKLDSFYYDWNAAGNGQEPKSSTSDVRKKLDFFNSQKVDGIVMDLRSNGGGSLHEAISLTGLFINGGPVVQVRGRNGDCDVKYAPSKGAHYKGPMIVLVNRMSASAAEIFAAAIRDHGRGIVVGDSQTHGKGTVQTVIGLEEFLRYWGINRDTGSIKITNAKFYRINGLSTQKKGVNPDINLPSITDSMADLAEHRLRNALEWDAIEPLKFKTWMDEVEIAKNIAVLKEKSASRVASNPEFKTLIATIEQYRKLRERKSVSLNLEKRFKSYEEDLKIIKEQEKMLGIDSEDDETPRLTKKIEPEKDIHLKESLNIISDLIKLDFARENVNRVHPKVGKK